MKGYITLKTMFEKNENTNMIKVRYLVVEAQSSYNIIIGRLAFNLLGVSISTLHLCMEYPLEDGGVKVIQGD